MVTSRSGSASSRVPPPSGRPDPLAVYRRIVDRDRELLSRLAEHYLLSTPQIAAAFFTGLRTAQRRLTILHRLGVVHRFARAGPRNGAVPYLYALGPVGLRLCPNAYHDPDGVHTRAPRSSLERARRIADSHKLAHLLGVNQFFIDLLATSGAAAVTAGGRCRLERWWSEQHATAVYAQAGIHLDGHGIWHAHGRTVGFFLEYDTGTEFSGGRGPCQSPDLRVSAAQRLMGRRYRPRQVWCKDVCGVSPARAADGGRTPVDPGQRGGGVGSGGHGSSVPVVWAWLCDAGFLSRVLGDRASELAAFRAWCPCRGSAWGRCACRCRDRYPNRPSCQPWAAAQGRFAGDTVLLRKTFRGLLCGGGIHA